MLKITSISPTQLSFLFQSNRRPHIRRTLLCVFIAIKHGNKEAFTKKLAKYNDPVHSKSCRWKRTTVLTFIYLDAHIQLSISSSVFYYYFYHYYSRVYKFKYIFIFYILFVSLLFQVFVQIEIIFSKQYI